MSEHDEQVAVINWFDAQYPKLSRCLMAYPSGAVLGGKNKYALIRKLKAEGWRNGVADLFLAIPAHGFPGLFIEMKDRGKTKSSVSLDQEEFLGLMAKQGYMSVWCAGSDSAILTIKDYLK